MNNHRYLFKSFIVLITILVCVTNLFSQSSSTNIVHSLSIDQGLEVPVRIATDNLNNIYVSDGNLNSIEKFDASGNHIESFVIDGSPLSVAVNKDEQIFVGTEEGAILKIETNALVSTFSNETVYPSAMDFSPNGDLYVVDREAKSVFVFDSFGIVVRTFGTGTLIAPTSIAFDSKNERVFVGEHGGLTGGFTATCKVWVFDLQGSLITSFGSGGNGNGKFYRIQGIDIGKCGNIYVNDPFQGNISVFNENLSYVTKFGVFGDSLSQLNLPMDVKFDSQERILVTSSNTGKIEIFNIVDSLPTSNIQFSDATICSGQTTDIMIAFTGTPPWDFTYTVDGVDTVSIITSENPYTLSVSSEGIYEITSLSDAVFPGTCFTGSADIKVTTAIPSSTIITTTETICEGDFAEIPITLTGTPPWNFSYSYNDNSTITAVNIGYNPYIIYAYQSGNYEAFSVSDKYCTGSEFSGLVNVTVTPMPEVSFSYNDNFLEVSFINSTTDADAYLWYFGDGQMSISSDPIHTYLVPGSYVVSLTASNSCSENSFTDSITVYMVSTEEVTLTDYFKIHPNPTDGKLYIEVDNFNKGSILVEIIDIMGKVVWSQSYYEESLFNYIDLGYMANGVYTLRLIENEMIKTVKLILNK